MIIDCGRRLARKAVQAQRSLMGIRLVILTCLVSVLVYYIYVKCFDIIHIYYETLLVFYLLLTFLPSM